MLPDPDLTDKVKYTRYIVLDKKKIAINSLTTLLKHSNVGVVNPNPTNFALTTDNYNSYFPQEEQPGRLTTAVGSLENDISADYGPTAITNDNLWVDNKYINKNYNTQNKDVKYVPRKERYRSIHRRHISKPKRIVYPEYMVSGRQLDDVNILTTAETSTEKLEEPRSFPENNTTNLTVRIKRWFQQSTSLTSERST